MRYIIGQIEVQMRSFLLTFAALRLLCAQDAMPMEWTDTDTGHRVIRLSREPGTASLYFHQNAYSADGRKLVVTNSHGIATIDLVTRAVDQVVEGRVNVLVTGHKTGQIYYTKEGAIFATDLYTHATHEVAKIPPQAGRGGAITVNADETILVGIAPDPDGEVVPRKPPPDGGGGRLETNWAAGTPKMLYTIDVKTGAFQKIYTENDWTNHLQMSPTDPHLIMFCHEGPWQFVDRIWTIRTDGTGLRLMHTRTMNMEIAGHEFFSGDGKTVWYDLQTPKSTDFWVAGVEIATGHRSWYHLERNEWSVHYNISADGKLFAGDGGGPNSVAARSPDGKTMVPPANGQWIYLFRPVMVAGNSFRDKKDLIDVGYFKSERLVNLAKHNYTLEPNVTFSPDSKWVVFRSNMLGPIHVFAVEVATH
jgi:oligogalacturonide lyase